jgi:hypothetical protein
MNLKRKAACFSIALCVAECFIGLRGAHGQQPATSTHPGASAAHSASPAGVSSAVRGAGSGGSSTWGAGKGSFGYSAQSGGVWRDGTTLNAAPSAGRDTTQAHTYPADAFPSGEALPPGSVSAKPTGMRGIAAPGAARLPRSSSGHGFGRTAAGRGPVSGSAGIRHVAGGSRGRVASPGRRAGRGTTRQTPGLATGVGKYPLTRGTAANSPLHRELTTGLSSQSAARLR